MAILKTFECYDCGHQSDDTVDVNQSDCNKYCPTCKADTRAFVAMNCKGMHYRFMSGWTEEVLEKSINTEVFATIGSEDGPRSKNKLGEDLSKKVMNSDRTKLRHDKLKFAKNKRRGKGKIYVG